MPSRRGTTIRRLLVTADALALTTSFMFAEALFGRHPSSPDPVPLKGEVAAFLVSLPAWLALTWAYGLYSRDDSRTNHSTADDVSGIFHVMTTGIVGYIALSQATDWVDLDYAKLFCFLLTSIATITVGRAAARAVWRRSSDFLQTTLIVADAATTALLSRKINHHPEYGLRVVSAWTENQPASEMAHTISAHGVRRVILSDTAPRAPVEEVLWAARMLGIHVDLVPGSCDLIGTEFDVHTIEGVTLLGLRSSPPSRAAAAIKRSIDMAGAVIGLIALSPVFVVAAWSIRRDSSGPVFFRQTRVGVGMRPFEIYKFRTMTVGDHSAAHHTYIHESMSQPTLDDGRALYKLDRADVVTRSGRWLRRTSLDELPQLLNVLKGEMSLVGPRPCLLYEVDSFEPHHFQRFLAKPGLTGLWQVTARAHSTFREALEMDVTYATSWTVGLDLWLILRTPLAVVRQRTGTH